jgi:hypothetical protein
LTRGATYIRNADGFRELYRAGDTWQVHNIADEARARDSATRHRALLASLSAEAQG